MWTLAVVAVALLGGVLCRPPIVTPHGNFSTDPLSERDLEWLHRNVHHHRGSFPPGFKFMYVSQTGQMAPDRKPSGDFIKIVGSPQTTQQTLYVAALEIHKMMKHADPQLFHRVANSVSGLGIFSAAETLTVFPDYAHMADSPACRGRCDGQCSVTCTFDGRKFSEIAGVTSTLALVLSDNVMCTPSDPYSHHDNIVVHEFAHAVDIYGFSHAEQQMKTAAYNNAKARHIWNLNTYAMANSAEYFGEATGAFFLVNLQTQGMTSCSYGPCHSETDSRNFIRSRDPALYNLLEKIYTNSHPQYISGLKICYH